MFQPTKEWVNKVNLSSFELENFFKFVLAWLARKKPNNLTPQPCLHTLMQTLLSANQSMYYLSNFVKVNSMCCTSTRPVNKQVLAFRLFVCNSSHHMYDDCSMKKQPISTAVVLEFREILKWITKSYWNLCELSECKNICHRDWFIFYITLGVFHNSHKCKLLTLIKKFICSTVVQTVVVLFASQLIPCSRERLKGLCSQGTQLTAAPPFSMRTSSLLSCCCVSGPTEREILQHLEDIVELSLPLQI